MVSPLPSVRTGGEVVTGERVWVLPPTTAICGKLPVLVAPREMGVPDIVTGAPPGMSVWEPTTYSPFALGVTASLGLRVRRGGVEDAGMRFCVWVPIMATALDPFGLGMEIGVPATVAAAPLGVTVWLPTMYSPLVLGMIVSLPKVKAWWTLLLGRVSGDDEDWSGFEVSDG